MKIATWNVRSMYEMIETERVVRVVREMERLRIDILGVSEMRWRGNGKFGMTAHTIYYTGNNEPNHYKGVGFIVAKKVNDAVRNFVPQSDHVALLQLNGKGVNINIVQVYAPTSNSDEEELEVFYKSISEVLKMTKREDVNIVMGDFNAKVGADPQGDVVGAWGLGVRNDRGERMIQFCQEENLIVANTYFQLPARRLYTWKSPSDGPDRRVRNQIDYLMINRRYRNAIKYVKTLPGADAGSDHNPVVGQIKLKLKTVKKKQKRAVIDPRRVNDERIRARVTEELARKTKSTSGNGNIEEVWQQVKGIVNEASEKHLTAEKWQHKVWMTDEILELMEERRLWKNVDDTRYKVLHKQIQRKIRQAKQMREEELCREIEMLDSRHDNAVLNIVEKKKLWETYIEELFHDVRDDRHGYENVESGPEILCEEVQYAIKRSWMTGELSYLLSCSIWCMQAARYPKNG